MKKLVTTISLSVILSSHLLAIDTCDPNGDGDYLVTQDFDLPGDGDDTLRACVSAAGSAAFNSGTSKKVVFDSDMHIILSGSVIYINGGTNNITIDGGEHNIVIDGNNTTQIFADSNQAIITLKNLTLQNGNAGDYGGGAISFDDAVIDNCVFSNNNASWGGAIYARGDLNITNSTIFDNNATGNGAIGNGGAIYMNNGRLVLMNSTISGNRADGITNGGGIYAYQSTIELWNSTISGNSASDFGGAIYNNESNASIMNSTIFKNSANALAAVMNKASSETKVMNSIIYDNNTTYGNDSDTLYSYGFNILNSVETITDEENLGTDKNDADPKLGPLRDNGGNTKTHALMGGSPAIDAGNSFLTSDQRGKPRKGASDIGSYEYQGMVLIPIYMLLL